MYLRDYLVCSLDEESQLKKWEIHLRKVSHPRCTIKLEGFVCWLNDIFPLLFIFAEINM